MATRPERRPRGQDRRGRHDAALSLPSGLARRLMEEFGAIRLVMFDKRRRCNGLNPGGES